MSKRTDNLVTRDDPYRQLVTIFKSIDANLAEIKSGSQRISGRSGMLPYTTQNGSGWDLTGSVPASTTGVRQISIQMTFTGDGTQKAPFVNPFLDVFVNGTAPSNRLSPLAFNTASSAPQLSGFLGIDKTYYTNNYTRVWNTTIAYVDAFTYNIKGYAKGSSRGSLTVVRLP